MLTVSNELKNAFMKAERTIFVRIKIGNRTFDNDNVVSVEYDSGSLSGEVFAIGSTYSNSVKITFSELVEGLKELDEVTYEIGIKLADNKIEYVPMGVFVINDAIEMDRNNNKTTIECMDRMVMMGGAYVSSLSYPAAIREVALEIANKAGVSVDVTSFERLSPDRIAKPEGYTYREAIGLIAQFEAGFATFNRYGKLEIRTLSDPNFAIPPDNYFLKGLVKNEVFFRLGGISCTTDDSEDEVIQSGNTAGNQVVLENRVMTKTLLDKIYQKIQTINYYPFSLSWQGNPVLEAGDWVEVEDLQGNKFKTPNLSYSLSFNGGLSAKSSAETVTQSDATYQYKSPLQQKIEWIHARIDAAGGNVVYEGIDEPANPKEGDLWFKIIGPDKEILIYKKDKDGNLFWDSQISTADIDKVAEKVNEAIKQVEEAEKSANNAVAKADQAIKDAGFAQVDASAAKTNAVNALTAANTAKTDAASAITKSNTAITDSSKALTNANSALTKVGAVEVTTGKLTTSYDELTKTVGLKADQTTVDGIKGTVTTQGLAISANATAIGLKADKSVVDTINGTVTKHTADIKANSDGLKLKADSSVVSTLSGTVATHTTQIKAASDGLALKADSTLVNTIKGTVDTHTTQIKATSDGLALKADSTLVNSIKGTVDSHSTQISANSTAISARLTSAQVETILSAKKYVNETVLNATADGLNASITQVSTDLGKLEIGERNLLLASGSSITNGNYPTKTYFLSEPIASDEVVTIVIKGKIFGNNYWAVYNSGGSVQLIPLKTNHKVSDDIWEASFIWKIAGTANTHINIYSIPNTVGFSNTIEWAKLVRGNKTSSDWSPAPEDMATLEQFTTIDATVKGLQTTVGNKAEQTQVTQLANQWTQTTALVNGHTGQISNLGEQINLRVTSSQVTESILNDKKIKDTRATNQIPSWYFTNYPNQEVREFKTRTVVGTPGSSTYVQLTTKVPWSGSSGGLVTQTAESADGVYQRVSNAASTAWLAWEKIVEAGELLSQINLQSGNILIQTGKLYLDAATVTFSGKAFIPSAAITELSVDKLNGGIANFAKFNAININASSITTGSLVGINIKSAANGSTFEVQGNNLKMTKANGDNLVMDTSGIYWKNSSGNVLFQTSNKMTTSDIFGTSEWNVYLAAFNESRSVTQATALTGAGAIKDYKYVPHRADGFYGNFLENNTGNSGFHIYVRPDFGGELRVTKPGQTDDYQPVRAQIAYAHRVALNTYNTSSNHLYIGAPDEVRFTSSNEGTTPTGAIRAGKVFTGSVALNTADGSGAFYLNLMCNNAVRIRNEASTAFQIIEASKFNVASSRDFKKDIEDLEINATELINSTPVRKYWFKEDDETIDYKSIGLVIQEAPMEVINFRGGETLDIYAMATLLWKAVQEQSTEISQLKQKIKQLESAA